MKYRAYLDLSKAAALWLVCLAIVPSLSPAQQPNKLSVAPPAQVVVKRGSKAEAVVRVSILDGFHVNSNTPKDEFLIPLQLTWSAGPVKADGVKYPKAELVQVGNDQLSVFTGTFDLNTELSAAPEAVTGPATLSGKLHYQACNNRMCFRPMTVDVRLPIVVQ